ADLQLVVVVLDPPGEVVDRADAPSAAPLVGLRPQVEHPARADALEGEALPAVLFVERGETEDAGEEARRGLGVALPEPRRVQASYLMLRRHRTAGRGRELAPWPVGRFDQGDAHAVRIDERQ